MDKIDVVQIYNRILLNHKKKTNLDSILKSRDITLPAKIHVVKAVSFPIVMYVCERRLGTEELMFSNCGAGEDS